MVILTWRSICCCSPYRPAAPIRLRRKCTLTSNSVLQASQIKERSTKFVNLTDAVAERLEMNQQLNKATEEAFTTMMMHDHIKHLDERNARDLAAGMETQIKRMAMQNQLRTVALAQTRELIQLFAEKEALVEKNVPKFRPAS